MASDNSPAKAKDTKELTDLMHEFNDTRDIAAQEIEKFSKMMEFLKKG